MNMNIIPIIRYPSKLKRNKVYLIEVDFKFPNLFKEWTSEEEELPLYIHVSSKNSEGFKAVTLNL